ncbi:MAG: hypothetical protein EXS31_10260 [Pedosphaera sp.]|nr:hypothetical protein [Pedosphaera sp.]
MKILFLAGALALSAVVLQVSAQTTDSTKPKPAPLFDDPVVAKGKDLEIRQSEVDDMFAAFRANRSASGQRIPESERPKIEADIIDKLIATRLCVRRASADDKSKGEQIAKEFIAEQIKQVPSEESFNRQLLAVGMTPASFKTQITEQAIVKAVIDRELRAQQTVTDPEIKKFYDGNPKLFEQPEMVRVAHVLISTLDSETTKEIPADQKIQKKVAAEKVLARAKLNDDFTSLVKEFSEDRNAKERNGEYTIMRNDKRFVLSPEFEGAAFSLASNQISSVVASPYGYHVIKCLEKIPAKKADLASVQDRIRETLFQEAVQKSLPDYIEKLRKEASVVLTTKVDGK